MIRCAPTVPAKAGIQPKIGIATTQNEVTLAWVPACVGTIGGLA